MPCVFGSLSELLIVEGVEGTVEGVEGSPGVVVCVVAEGLASRKAGGGGDIRMPPAVHVWGSPFSRPASLRRGPVFF